MSLIPQDPFLISGTVRSNIDPFNKFSDSKILQTLHETAVYEILKSTIERSETADILESKVPGKKKNAAGKKAEKKAQDETPMSIDQ